MSEKKKIFVIADHPMAPSGVGTQTKYFIDALLKTGRYQVRCFGGAVRHEDYKPQKTHEYGDDFVIFPVDAYGTQESVRSLIWTEKPDLLWFMTDPRFYEWLWLMENEIRSVLPMVYYHVWDNYPYPKYNKKFYDSNDVVASISKVTYDIVSNVSPEVENHYLPHAVNGEIFKAAPAAEIEAFKEANYGDDHGRLTFFWNNRNARRKMSGSLVWWFSEFAEKVGPEKVRLIMHTDARDPNGPDLFRMIEALGFDDDRILISGDKLPPEGLAMLYSTADCTITISDAEGFGLSTLESLSCQTPIIVSMTGGLQEQVTDGKEWFGIGIEPASKAVIGSQQVPYIYEDRISKEDFIAALEKIFHMTEDERREMGVKGRAHVEKNYNFDEYGKKWVDLIDNITEKYGSWDSRTGYQAWKLLEVA